jgi:hypothetical protein
MSRSRNKSKSGAMLDLWRPPAGAGDPVGCLATTYTFTPGLFDEQCLARFLEIESEPNREDLAFLLERENRLGGVYAGIMVDHTRAGVEHSLRWDVLPVRVRGARQHAKISLLAWSHHMRIIVASANLSEPGYRTNHEVAAVVDLIQQHADQELLTAALGFLRGLLLFVPAGPEVPPEVKRAQDFLEDVERRTRLWEPLRRGETIRQHLVCTLPRIDEKQPDRSSLEEAVEFCRHRGVSPNEAWVASPFFDADAGTSPVTAALCKLLARGGRRGLWFALPAADGGEAEGTPRIAAPKSLLLTPRKYQGEVNIELLPAKDEEENPRPWHAKMLAFRAEPYSALMVGSSNFTGAGMGVGTNRNAEANLLTIIDRVSYGRESGELEAIWPEMAKVDDPETAEWIGARPTGEDEEETGIVVLPSGFLPATYCAGDSRQLILRFAPDAKDLPADWRIYSHGQNREEILNAASWRERGSAAAVPLTWVPVQPPEKLRVCWLGGEGFLPLNVQDSRALPPPARLDQMSADDVLRILAATDPSAAFRAWAKRQQSSDAFDAELDSAAPADLDPLGRYDLEATFLHRIRRRARILAQLRANLERPVWGKQALEWRLRGMLGIQSLADRMVREFEAASPASDEALLALADFLIVLREIDYQASEGAIPKAEFQAAFRPFLKELADRIHNRVSSHLSLTSLDITEFWERIVDLCRA